MDGGNVETLVEKRPNCNVKMAKSLWEHRAAEIAESNKHNPFSHSFEGGLHVDAEHYGHPVEGSLTDIRGRQAAAWVDAELDRLLVEIRKIGTCDPAEGGSSTVTFGELFNHYQDISNTLVGILMRAKKRKLVKYEGEMLYQHSSKNVKITLLV